MGVHGLWPILEKFSEKKPISHLYGKTLAVDLSGWIVEARLCEGLKYSKNSHLRNTFFRTSHLLKNRVIPICVLDGKPPLVKENTLKQRKRKHEAQGFDSTSTREGLNLLLQQCKEMLICLGVPCFESCGEAEAFCALLDSRGVVDGVITEDNDVFLYGANTVYRDFNLDKKDKSSKEYKISSEENHPLSRQKLVALSLLIGSDYTTGVPHIGSSTALKLLDELGDVDILKRFKEWKDLPEEELFPCCNFIMAKKKLTHCHCCSHPGTQRSHTKSGCGVCKNDAGALCTASVDENICLCEWCLNKQNCSKFKTEFKIYKAAKDIEGFPNETVIDEYLKFENEVPKAEHLEWKCPNVVDFSNIMMESLGWSIDYSLKQCFPLITSWQLHKLYKFPDYNRASFPYELNRICKKRRINSENYFEVIWKSKEDPDSEEEDCVHLSTELVELFSECYPLVTKDFLKIHKAKKEVKQPKSVFAGRKRSSKNQDAISNMKITDCFQKQIKLNSENITKEENFQLVPEYEKNTCINQK